MILEALVNPFKGLESETPDQIEKLKVEKDELVERVLSQYNPKLKWEDSPDEPNAYTLLQEMNFETLTPVQIDIVLQKIIALSENQLFLQQSFYSGLFLSKLIQKSHDAGNKQFVLHTNESQICNLCMELKDSDVLVYGNVGNSFGRDSENCNFKVSGDAGLSFGAGAKKCNYWLDGQADGIAIGSKECTFVLRKKTQDKLCSLGSDDCTFYCTDIDVYLDMLTRVRGINNKVEFQNETND